MSTERLPMYLPFECIRLHYAGGAKALATTFAACHSAYKVTTAMPPN